jgi:peptidoglycan hydrolase-like protein with peptidoglycan-binding domain
LYDLVDAPERIIFSQNLEIGDTGALVHDLQSFLSDLGYEIATTSGVFDASTKAAVLAFQQAEFILDTRTQQGAGRFGPKTRQKLSDVLWHDDVQQKITELWQSFQFEDEINHGERSSEVSRLQLFLVEREYLAIQPTGFFGSKTKQALIDFQLEEALVFSEQQRGAGNFGPKTLARVNQLLEKKSLDLKQSQSQAFVYEKTQYEFTMFAQGAQPQILAQTKKLALNK